ncbi:hypothetical protein AALO_G00298270 [Alosa alosa]|uniref:Uncharacterized protein n=1 Tax=Alosa alosa TaxID=278164 RepID=A0AAV6FIP8_9TELE|nr:hypothetical protein AALO_G00298270 [Alosa alosa]
MMFCSRCLLPALVLYLFLEELSAFLLPDRIRRNADWMDQESSPHWSELSDLTDLFPGDSGETTQDWGSRHNQMTPFLTPLERLPASQHVGRNRRRHKHKRVTAPLDSIGVGLLSSHHGRKDEPMDIWEDYTD